MQVTTQVTHPAKSGTYAYVRYMRDGTAEQRVGVIRSRRKVKQGGSNPASMSSGCYRRP